MRRVSPVRVMARRAGVSLAGEARYPISGGPRPVSYPNGADVNCPVR